MVASTISNSGGPGSPTELSPVTIAVRDKVIEKFKDQPLKEMNESLKMLLANEQDEQKRLGILAGRVFILRQRIAALAETDQQRVVSTASPAPKDTEAPVQEDTEAGGDTTSEWTRLRILDDCEVNGVRFPKTVIIDVKSSDAQRLIDSGNAELVDEQPPGDAAPDAAPDTAGEAAGDDGSDASAMQTELENAETAVDEAVTEPGAEDDTRTEEADAASTDTPAEDTPAEEAPAEDAAATMEGEEANATEADTAAEPQDEAAQDTVIETPSAAEVTAALAALGSGDDSAEDAAQTSDDTGDGADPAADDEAAAVAAELEAAAGAMTAPSADPDADDTDDSGKPGGWFEAQQNAEKAAKAEAGDDQEPAPEDEGPKDEK
ncbi:hypothetical protein AB3X55_09125 [Alphaproteobacteria bacterium LSUCC0719]